MQSQSQWPKKYGSTKHNKTKHNLKQQNRKYHAGLTDELSPICKARRPRTGLPNVVLPTCHQATPYARHILYQYNIMISKNKDAT